IHASDVFVDKLGLVARGLDASGLSDQCGHEFPPPRAARARISGYTKPGHPDGGTSARHPSCDNLKDRDKGFREWMRFQESRSADPESRSAPGCRELRWAECPEFQECDRCRDSPAGPGEAEEEPAAALQPAPPRLARQLAARPSIPHSASARPLSAAPCRPAPLHPDKNDAS